MDFQYEESGDGFLATLSYFLQKITSDSTNRGLNEGLNEGLKSLLKTITENLGVQAKDLAESLNRPIKTVEGQIKTLTDKNLIERRGSKKTGGYWPL
jgi:ATP-dependent DNA helicase RecG